jgi:hypothetical protein
MLTYIANSASTSAPPVFTLLHPHMYRLEAENCPFFEKKELLEGVSPTIVLSFHRKDSLRPLTYLKHCIFCYMIIDRLG